MPSKIQKIVKMLLKSLHTKKEL